MTYRLPAVLSESDFDVAELSALVLTGEVYRVGECVSPADVVPAPQHRAAALRAVLPEKLIAEQRTAAWVWGALFVAPHRYDVCADAGRRSRVMDPTRFTLREVVITEDEMVDFDGMKVTTPMRTAIDIARFSADFGDGDADIIARLMLGFNFDARMCVGVMDGRRNLPNKRVATARLIAAEARRPELIGHLFQ
jgi:hypothetical protein